MVPIDRLKKLKIFQEAPTKLLEKLSAEMMERGYKAGETICREGEPGGNLYVIESGQVAIEKKSFSPESSSKVVARLSPGDFFGEMAFLQGLPHSATVSAQQETVLILLSRSSLDEVIKKDAAS